MKLNLLTFTICLFLAFVASAQSAYKGYTPIKDLEAFKKEFAKASASTNTIKSDFVQEKHMSMLSDKIVSKGNFWFKKENQVRLEYKQPFQYLMIMSKGNIIIKDGQKTNKVNANSNKLFQQINQVTIDCVKGNVLNNKDFSVKVFENEKYVLMEMTPVNKNMKEFFTTIVINIEKKDYSVQKMTMNEPSGDYTIINFLNKQLNTPLADDLFTVK